MEATVTIAKMNSLKFFNMRLSINNLFNPRYTSKVARVFDFGFSGQELCSGSSNIGMCLAYEER